MKFWYRLFLGIALLALVANLAYRLDTKVSPHELVGELMYFPSGAAIHALAVGYHAPLADLVWLRFIQYYGEHRMTDVKFEMMYHILDILTTLDKHFTYAYTLGGLMLTHDAQRPDQARHLLKKGMYLNPEDWRLPFMYGFIHYVFLSEYRIAQTYFIIATQKPDAPDMPRRWAAFTTQHKIGDLETGRALWYDLYKTTTNPEEEKLALYYYRKFTMQLHIKLLNEKITLYYRKFSRYPRTLDQLVYTGIMDSLPQEPHGAKYVIVNHEAISTWPYYSK